MKLKDIQLFRSKSIPELETKIDELRDALFALRIDQSQSKLKNTRSISQKRKEIAQLLTIRKENKLSSKEASTKGA